MILKVSFQVLKESKRVLLEHNMQIIILLCLYILAKTF